MKQLFFILILFTGGVLFSGCSKEGCTDSVAVNYDSSANDDDGTCEYCVTCTDFLGIFANEEVCSADFNSLEDYTSAVDLYELLGYTCE